MKTLIVVDMQNDFIDGALGTKEAVAIVNDVKKEMELCRKEGGQIIFTKDTHFENYLETQEGKRLPVTHCVKGTEGWKISTKLEVKADDIIIEKLSFGFDWATALKANPTLIKGDEIELIGLCTDICVISNALGLKTVFPEKRIYVDASCCAGVTPDSHMNALEAMKMCQIDIIY